MAHFAHECLNYSVQLLPHVFQCLISESTERKFKLAFCKTTPSVFTVTLAFSRSWTTVRCSVFLGSSTVYECCSWAVFPNIQYFLFKVCLPDSILAFHKHGVQGRSIKNGEITQEIVDRSKSYRLLGSDK